MSCRKRARLACQMLGIAVVVTMFVWRRAPTSSPTCASCVRLAESSPLLVTEGLEPLLLSCPSRRQAQNREA